MQITPRHEFAQTLDRLESQVRKIEIELDEPTTENSGEHLSRVQKELLTLATEAATSQNEITKMKSIPSAGPTSKKSEELNVLAQRQLAVGDRTRYCGSLLEKKWAELASIREAAAKSQGIASFEDKLSDLERQVAEIEEIIAAAASEQISSSTYEKISSRIGKAHKKYFETTLELLKGSGRSESTLQKLESLRLRLSECSRWLTP